jgi:hypothetical protein
MTFDRHAADIGAALAGLRGGAKKVGRAGGRAYRRGMRALAAAVAAFALGCGVRQVPGGGPAAPAPAPGPRPSTLGVVAADPGPASTAVIAPDYPRAPDGGIVWSRLPAPHRDGPEPLPAIASVEDARRLVGRRARHAPLALALAWSSSLTGRAAPAVATEAALIAWAQAGDAWRSLAIVAPGDLIVFDRAVGGARASLVAVALGRDPRGVVEVLYLGGGVVRRGFRRAPSWSRCPGASTPPPPPGSWSAPAIG